MPNATVVDIMRAIREADQQPDRPHVIEPEARKVLKELPDGAREAIDAFVAAKELKAYADAQKDAYEEVIRKMLDGADIGTIDGREVVRLNQSHNSRLDAQIVKSGWPEAFQAAYKRTDYDYLSVK
jgi:hypothetical protein